MAIFSETFKEKAQLKQNVTVNHFETLTSELLDNGLDMVYPNLRKREKHHYVARLNKTKFGDL